MLCIEVASSRSAQPHQINDNHMDLFVSVYHPRFWNIGTSVAAPGSKLADQTTPVVPTLSSSLSCAARGFSTPVMVSRLRNRRTGMWNEEDATADSVHSVQTVN